MQFMFEAIWNVFV